MLHIVVSDEQARLIGESTDNVEIRDRNGNLLGYVAHGFSEEDIAISRSRAASSQPRLTTPQVLSYLNSLEPR
jgi:hypothetical protein